MEPLAVEQAKSRLVKAGEALQALKSATNYQMAESAWTDFLIAASTIYSKLEQGSKKNGKSRGWFGLKKRERKDDPLLRYLHQARNSDEHGIERVVERVPGSAAFGRTLRYGERVPVQIAPIDPITGKPGEFVEGFIPGQNIALIRVYDRRFNDFCDPPTEHRGKPVDSRFVYELGIVAFDYLTELLSEAETLI
jgi:hypothetical protein